jgi:hypothetical protein
MPRGRTGLLLDPIEAHSRKSALQPGHSVKSRAELFGPIDASTGAPPFAHGTVTGLVNTGSETTMAEVALDRPGVPGRVDVANLMRAKPSAESARSGRTTTTIGANHHEASQDQAMAHCLRPGPFIWTRDQHSRIYRAAMHTLRPALKVHGARRIDSARRAPGR